MGKVKFGGADHAVEDYIVETITREWDGSGWVERWDLGS
jgi:hypothetical protein